MVGVLLVTPLPPDEGEVSAWGAFQSDVALLGCDI
jgi:hypothetical protein